MGIPFAVFLLPDRLLGGGCVRLVFARERLQAGGGRAVEPLRTALCDCLALPKSLVVSIASSEFFLSDLFPVAAFRGRRACF